jgi:hypothetical protein
MSRVIRDYLESAKSRDRKAMMPVTARNIRYVLDLFTREAEVESLADLAPNSMSTWLKGPEEERAQH